MRIVFNALILALASTWASGAEIHSEKAVLIFMKNIRGDLQASYWVEWEQLARQQHWVPESDPLPTKLSSLVGFGRTEVLLARGVTNRFDLNSLAIDRVPFSKTVTDNFGITTAEFSNQWAVSTEFLVHRVDFSVRPIQRVVLLFDGTVAAERAATTKEIVETIRGQRPLPQPRPMPEPEGVMSPSRGTQSRTESDPQNPNDSKAELFGVLLQPPNIQWPPGSEFPLDLTAGPTRALAAIRTQCEVEEPLFLERIRIDRYHRIGPPNFLTPEWHWYVAFDFHDAAKNGSKVYSAVMLLDGSILKAFQVPVLGE